MWAPGTIAATSTLAMARAAASRGIDVRDLLAEAGLTLEYLEDPDARIPRPTVLAVWNALRERTGDPALQLVAPTSLPFGAYRVIEYMVAASATVGDGVHRFARFFGLIADDVKLSVVEGADECCLQLATVDGGAVPPVYVDYVFAAFVGRVRMRIRPDLRVCRVELRQPEPRETVPYRRLFDAPVHFGAGADRLCFAREEWGAQTVSGDSALVALLEEHARILAARPSRAVSDFAVEVEKAIASGLPDRASAEAVARALHMSVRTLQRRLTGSGTTFRQVADAVRARLAQGYLADRKVSIPEVAFMLGFSEESAFSRAFRRWTGESPSRWRRR